MARVSMYGILSAARASNKRWSHFWRVRLSAGAAALISTSTSMALFHGGADRPRRAVDVLERGRHLLEEQHRPFWGQHRVLTAHVLIEIVQRMGPDPTTSSTIASPYT
jgi:hypothetical protein